MFEKLGNMNDDSCHSLNCLRGGIASLSDLRDPGVFVFRQSVQIHYHSHELLERLDREWFFERESQNVENSILMDADPVEIVRKKSRTKSVLHRDVQNCQALV